MAKSELLQGIRVIDITIAIAGPTVTYLLQDMGADVIKVEHPVRGDDTRHFVPQKNGVSASFISVNRGKRDLAVDLNTREGQEIIQELAKTADALVENFTPGTMKRWNIDYETLSKINPGLVMCSVSGYGQTGPMSQLPGYDIVGQAMSGIMSVTGHPGGPPTRVGVLIGDTSSGAFGCAGLLAALLYKQRTGLGQHVDISMQDVLLSYYDQPTYTWDGRILGRTGNRVPTIAPFDTYRTKDDRWVIIPAANDKLWGQLCEIMGRPGLAGDPRFDTNPNRCANYDELNDEITKWTSQHNLMEIIGLLQSKGQPVAPIMNIDEILGMPHVQERKMCIEVDDPIAGKVKTIGQPIKFSRTPCVVDKSAPLLGENTREILIEIGYSEERISRLARDGVIKVR
ncbi:MAG: CoA transferase [Firmicutes bacterium]|nr:CoA transferase [Bacillota bacterium]